MNIQFKTARIFVAALMISQLAVSPAWGNGPLRRLLARRKCASAGVECCAPCAPVCVIRDFEFLLRACPHSSYPQPCHCIGAVGRVKCRNNSPPTKCYMVVGMTCPLTDCGSGNGPCTTPDPNWIESNPITSGGCPNTYDVTFPDFKDSGDLRCIAGNTAVPVCFVVCYADNTCKVEPHPDFNPYMYCNDGMTVCAPCVMP